MKKKLILLISLVGVLLIATLFFVLNYFGVLKIGADAVGDTKTYTISGRSFDPLANAPMAGQTINISSDTGQTAQAVTDSNGNYSAKIIALTEGFINVVQGGGGMEGDTCSFIADAALSKTCDFNLGKPPFDENKLFQEYDTSINALQSGSSPSEPNLTQLDPVIIDGVNYKPFVTLKDPKYKPDLSGLKDQIAFDVEWLHTLKSVTGVTDDFPVILVNKIDWHEFQNTMGLLSEEHHTYMALRADSVNRGPALISHEFAHHVDWEKGWDDVFSHHPSSKSPLFLSAFKEIFNEKVISGYATGNSKEMFAEFFATIMEPRGSDPTQIDLSSTTGQHHFANAIASYLLQQSVTIDRKVVNIVYPLGVPYFSLEDAFRTNNFPKMPKQCLSSLKIFYPSEAEKIRIQNALMYIYKHVAKMSGQIEYFPGSVSVGPGYASQEVVLNGNYMGNEGVVTLTFHDHHDVSLVNSKVSLPGATCTIGPDHYTLKSGCWVLPVQTGKQEINASNIPADYPVPYVGDNWEINHGANFVPIRYKKFSVQYKVYPSAYPSGGILAPSTTSLYGEFQAKSGQKVTGLTKGSIPLYSDDGTVDGVYGVDTKFTATLPPSEIGKARYYYIEYVIGGGDDFLFPIKETLYGPSAFPRRFLNTKTQFEFDPRPGTGEGTHVIQGVFSKFYKYLPTSSPIFQPLN